MVPQDTCELHDAPTLINCRQVRAQGPPGTPDGVALPAPLPVEDESPLQRILRQGRENRIMAIHSPGDEENRQDRYDSSDPVHAPASTPLSCSASSRSRSQPTKVAAISAKPRYMVEVVSRRTLSHIAGSQEARCAFRNERCSCFRRRARSALPADSALASSQQRRAMNSSSTAM